MHIDQEAVVQAGGSINIFYKTGYKNNGTFSVNGGQGGIASRNGESANGGTGGTGSISVGSILTGTYVSTYSN